MSNFRDNATFPKNGGVIRNPLGSRSMRGVPYQTHRIDLQAPPQFVSQETNRNAGLTSGRLNSAPRSQRLLGARNNTATPSTLNKPLTPPPITPKRVSPTNTNSQQLLPRPPQRTGTLLRPPLLQPTRTNNNNNSNNTNTTPQLLAPPPLPSLQSQPKLQLQPPQQTVPRLPPQSTSRNLQPNLSARSHSRNSSIKPPPQFQFQQNPLLGFSNHQLQPPPLPHEESLPLNDYDYYDYYDDDLSEQQAYPMPPQVPLSQQPPSRKLANSYSQQPVDTQGLLSAISGFLQRQWVQPPPTQSSQQQSDYHSLLALQPPPLSSPQQQQQQQYRQPSHNSPSHQAYHPKAHSPSPNELWAGLSPAEKHQAWSDYYASLGLEG